MLSESVFTTGDLPARDRFGGWVERLGTTHAPMRVASDHADDYRAVQRTVRLGPATVWPAVYQQMVSCRTPRLIRASDPEIYHISLLLNGTGTSTWGKGATHYRPYDLYCNDSSRVHEVRAHGDTIRQVSLEVPKALVPVTAPQHKLDRLVERQMSGREGVGSLLAQFLLQVSGNSAAYEPRDGARLGTVLTDLVAALFAHGLEAEDALQPETRRRTLQLRIQDFIRRHLHDRELTPRSIAAAHHISVSYLHRLFQDEDRTVAALVRRLRLEGARRDLADPAQSGTPIHAIAARWGFPSASDFTRAHRADHGGTPSDFRGQALGQAGPACGPSAK